MDRHVEPDPAEASERTHPEAYVPPASRSVAPPSITSLGRVADLTLETKSPNLNDESGLGGFSNSVLG
jgi:hypothetical protein